MRSLQTWGPGDLQGYTSYSDSAQMSVGPRPCRRFEGSHRLFLFPVMDFRTEPALVLSV